MDAAAETENLSVETTTETPVEAQENFTTDVVALDQDRIHVQNLPKFMSHKDVRRVLEKQLSNIKVKKMKIVSDFAYVSFETKEEAENAIKLLDGFTCKKNVLKVHFANTDSKVIEAPKRSNENFKPKTAVESVTPLAGVPYEQQIEQKFQASQKTMENLFQKMRAANVPVKSAELKKRLQPVIPSPKTEGYRNKCELTMGKSLDNEKIIGFVGGRFAKSEHYVIPMYETTNISEQMKNIIRDVEQWIKSSDLDTFNEFERVGFWRMLTVREFGSDVMIIITVHPLDDKEKVAKLKSEAVERFLNPTTLTEKKFRISSVYWQEMIHNSDPVKYEHLGGAPYIYESLHDCRFRVSPGAFFQTNSQAASVLYSSIGQHCGLESAKVPEKVPQEDDDTEVPEKKPKLDVESPEVDPGTVFLDICCGTGTISQCVLKEFHQSNKIFCVGVEIIESAVEDAKQNAKVNKMSEITKYVAGKAEDVFRSLKFFIPKEFHNAKVVGVLDPPRAGMHDKVIHACREMNTLKRLVYVSCDPNAAIKNIVDLCRPESRKFIGDPFNVTVVQPVDMFPQTKHVEWIIQLDRDFTCFIMSNVPSNIIEKMTKWLWPQAAMRSTPSIQRGMRMSQEVNMRREGLKVINEIGSILRFKANPTIGAALTYYHRFYMFHPFQDFPREITALGCVFLAGKVEETPKKCRDLCNAAISRYPALYNHYPNLLDDVMGIERVLLQTLKFDLNVNVPYEALLHYSEQFPQITKEDMDAMVSVAWTFINDSYYTTLILTTDPQIIAICLLHLASTLRETPLKQPGQELWWSNDVSNLSKEECDLICHLVLDFYSAIQKNPVLAKVDGNHHSEAQTS